MSRDGVSNEKNFFLNAADRNDLIDRLAALSEEGAIDVYAWVLIPNHVLEGAALGRRPELVGGRIGQKSGGLIGTKQFIKEK